MQIDARQFNSDGINELKRIFSSARQGYKNTQAAKFTRDNIKAVNALAFDDKLTSPLSGFHLEADKKFKNRLELGKYLSDVIPNNSEAVEYQNVGFWSWVSALYLDQILKPNSGGKTFQLWTNPRYIPEHILSKRRYYRNLCFLPYWICKSHSTETAEFFLMLPPYQHSDIIEQLYADDQSFVAYPGVVDVAKKLYIDPQKGVYRPNTTGRTTAGSGWRLAKVICKQWELNYDLQALSSDSIWNLLPAEFNGWKRIAKAE